jgi:hypothetical protein
MKKIIWVTIVASLIILAGSGGNLFVEELPNKDSQYGLHYSELLSSGRYYSAINESYEKPPAWQLQSGGNDSLDRMFGVGLRFNYFTPKIDVKSDSLKAYYADKYASNPSASFLGSYSDLEFNNKISISGFVLDFKFTPSPSWQVVFSYETVNEVRAAISGSGTFTALNSVFTDADVITLDKIRLMTFGANYTIILHPTDAYYLSAIRSPIENTHKILPSPPFPSVKLNLGFGLQQVAYDATDKWAASEVNTIAKIAIAQSFTDSISIIKPAFWVDLDIHPDESFSIILSGRYLDLSSEAKWGGDKADITFQGLSFALGAMISF